jgi:methionyl-tRNA formyltransferase
VTKKDKTRVVLVLSQANYVLDNHLALLKTLTDPQKLPEGVEIVGIVLVKTVSFTLYLKMVAMFFLGVHKLSTALIRNMFRALFNDPRKAHCKKLEIPVIDVISVNQRTARQAISALSPDLILNVRTRNIYRKKILELPRIGCINVHHGMLPDNRGTMSDLWAWVEGRPVGYSLHWMNRKIDDGDLIAVEEVDVSGINCYADIPMKSSLLEASKLLECLEKIHTKGRYTLMPNITQNERYTRNPTVSEIRSIRKKGLKL